MAERVQLYCFGPMLRENDLMETPAFSKIRQILFGIIGTTYFVLDIVHSRLNMICAQGILATCHIRVKVPISQTFSVVVVFSWTLFS